MKKTISIIFALVLVLPLVFCTNNQTEAKDITFAKRLSGRLLLDVENGGSIWYVDTKNYNKHNVTWDNAMQLFKEFSLGITDKDLSKIPASVDGIPNTLDTDQDGYPDIVELQNGYNPYSKITDKIVYDSNLANRLKGELLLQVEQGGAIWYVDIEGIRHSVTFENLMPLFESLALGISEVDLGKFDEDGYESLLLTETEVRSVFSYMYENKSLNDSLGVPKLEERGLDIEPYFIGRRVFSFDKKLAEKSGFEKSYSNIYNSVTVFKNEDDARYFYEDYKNDFETLFYDGDEYLTEFEYLKVGDEGFIANLNFFLTFGFRSDNVVVFILTSSELEKDPVIELMNILEEKKANTNINDLIERGVVEYEPGPYTLGDCEQMERELSEEHDVHKFSDCANCYAEIAVSQEDIYICDKASEPNLSEHCRIAYAQIKDDPDMCSNVSDKGLESICYMSFTVSGDLESCEKLNDRYKEICYLSYVGISGDKSYCEYISSDVDTRGVCD